MIKDKPDFIAKLIYTTTEEGGRESPAHSGYRPQVKFDFEKIQTSGEQIFIDKEIVCPGETVMAKISIISDHLFKHKLFIGLKYEFREGERVIGTGEIIEILNKELEK